MDTNALDAQESQAGDAMSNAAEAAILQQMTAALASGGVPLADIGLVSPYRSQVTFEAAEVRNLTIYISGIATQISNNPEIDGISALIL